MYTKDDVLDLFEKLKSSLDSIANTEISYHTNMNGINDLNKAIFIQLLLHQADRANVTLKVETSQVQNLKNVQEMNEFVNMMDTPSLPTSLGQKGNVVSKLSSITVCLD